MLFHSIDFSFFLVFCTFNQREKRKQKQEGKTSIYKYLLLSLLHLFDPVYFSIVNFTKPSSFDTYSLYDFNTRGRAEAIRLIFAQANKKFEDIRYEKEDWSHVKSEMPLEQLPVLGRNSSVLFYFH
jgi:hypothetical protein